MAESHPTQIAGSFRTRQKPDEKTTAQSERWQNKISAQNLLH